jgi:hypothetical protein
MAESPQYATIRVHEDIRDEARLTKLKLGVDWSSVLDRAANELDPDEQTTD